MRSFQYRMFRRIVFMVGRAHFLDHFPYLSFSDTEKKIDFNEIMLSAYPCLQVGDVVLHRDDGYWSNIGIGGAMIHAGLYVGESQLVEATQHGVLKRHVGHILHSDRACIVRPRFPSVARKDRAITEAVKWAEKIVGFEYDVLFDFNGKEEREIVAALPKEEAKKEVRFCCTEVGHFCYFDYIDDLNLYRRRNVTVLTRLLGLFGLHPGDKIIDADMYITSHFDLVWCSKLFTPEWSEKMGCSEAYVAKVAAHWKQLSIGG
jgi:hypothetical protein